MSASTVSRRRLLAGLSSLAVSGVSSVTPAFAYEYEGAEWVEYESLEEPGTVIINTHKRRLYQIMGYGEAVRYGVAVGREGFQWAGVAKVGRKQKWPRWTPPASMIKRKPELARWANGMPGRIRQNPLGARAIYLFANGRDTLLRIHGTNEPRSIGKAASSGCFRMLNEEVVELYDNVQVGTKVIVI
jgi:lipoprotein-anchoring transpeptidase ErfK/SrfK